MRTFWMVVSTSVLLILLVACDNNDEGKNIPRTVPPATLGTVATPDVTLPPSGKRRIQGTGPVYET